MPNWCENDLRVTGEASEVERFFESVKSEQSRFDFNKIKPYPVEFEVMDREHAEKKRERDGFNSGGYEWRLRNWGTKWNACEVTEVVSIRGGKMVSFSTAWSPPTPLIERASIDWPKLTFDIRYYEAGIGFKGRETWKAGKILRDETGRYNGPRGG